ncbi:MAG TPA: aminotransferase class V-fold PLP-dependent enzyme [Candidatus Methylomirabilis sp.]|nr:aminotransferase class V-fold PLP-dependent enzyme [Candidatus Methylomirabilis sp.]
MDWQSVRSQFPITQNYIFFDLANKCALPRFATRAIQEYAARQEQHSGDKAEWFRTIEEARGRFAQIVNARPTEVAILKNTSEGLNVAANGIPFKPGDNVVVNLSEHPNNIYCWLNLQRRGVEVRWAPTRDGEVTLDALAATVDERTRALAIALVTYAPGNRNDVKAMAAFCRERGIYTVVDAVQAVGTLNVDVADLGVDMLATSGHKALFVPHGVGLFFCRQERLDDIAPFYVARSSVVMPVAVEHDATHYELALAPSATRYEIGNNNYLGITVLNESLKYLLDLGMTRIERRILELSGYLTEQLLTAGFEVLSPREAHRRSAIVCVRVAEPARLHAWLLGRKVITTCRRDSLRLSLGIYNAEAEIDAFTDLLKAYPG